MTDKCFFCNNSLLPKEEINVKIYGNPVCNSAVCIDKANLEAKEAIDAAMSPRDKVISYFAREKFKEQGMTKGLFILEGETQIAVNMNKLSDEFPGAPVVGVYAGGNILESGHGVNRLEIIIVNHRNNIVSILKSKPAPKAKEQPAPKQELKNDPLFCIECKTSEFVTLHHEGEYTIYKCRCGLTWREREQGKAGAKPPAPKEPPKQPEVVAPEKAEHRPDAIIPSRVFTPQGNYIKTLTPRLKEIGKIKIGEKGDKTTGSGHKLPVKFDHFQVTGIIRDEITGKFLPDPIMQQLGEKPRKLNVMFLYNDPTLICSTRYNAYKGGKCLCAGDGRVAKTAIGDEIICNPDNPERPMCKTYQEKSCKKNGILSCILTDSPRLGGVYKFRTTSSNSINSIMASLLFFHHATGGILAMIPFELTVSPMQVQPANSQTMQTIYVVNIEYNGNIGQLLEKTIEIQKYQGNMRVQIQENENQAKMALCAPESEEEIKDIQAEFYPEKQEVK